MVDKTFYKNAGPFTLSKISEFLNSKYSGNKEKIISDIAPVDDADQNEICFVSDKYKDFYNISDAGAFIIKDSKQLTNEKNIIFSNNPHFDMAKVAALFYPEADYPKFSFDTIDCIKGLSKSIRLSSNVFIHKTASIGDNCEIGCNSIIGPGVKIGENCLIGDNVSIYFSIVGENVKIYQGVKIGSEGFGFIMNENTFKKIPQLGRVIIGNNVEIGANSTIDRGSIGDTEINDYCMIDNIVHLGHNVKLGQKCVIAAMTGISGSTTIGNNVMIGGQVGISGHLKIGNNVKIAAKTGIMKNIDDNEVIAGYPSEKIFDWHRNTIILKNLRQNDKKK